MQIEHIRIHTDSLLTDQYLLDLGRVNVLTGKNSSGKSTVLKTIKEKPDPGFTFWSHQKWKTLIRSSVAAYSSPSPAQVSDWVEKIPAKLEGLKLFSSKQDELISLIRAAKDESSARGHNLQTDILNIAKAIIAHDAPEYKSIILSPKRKLPHEAQAQSIDKLDNEAQNALSRLFFLKNQALDEHDHQCYKNIFGRFGEITGHHFDVQMQPGRGSTIIELRFRRGAGGTWIQAHNEGLGLSEILTMITYSLDGDYDLVLIEEPENHLHPDLQRRLLGFLNTIEDRQFILSTHSPIFLNTSLVDRIYLSRFDGKKIEVTDNTNRVEALKEIGFLATDNLSSDAVIITEGKTDWMFLEHVIRNWLRVGNRASISFVPLAGSMMLYFDPSPFAEVRNTFVLLDLDTKNKRPQEEFIKRCNAIKINVDQLKWYCLESYFTLEAIRNVFPELIPRSISKLESNVAPWVQLADDKHSADWWEGELKSPRRVQVILSHMELSDIEGTDLHAFCQKVASTHL